MPVAIDTDELLTVPEISKLLKIDRHTVTALFANERDVIVIGNRETQRSRRRYRQFRVPHSVFNRVIARMTNK